MKTNLAAYVKLSLLTQPSSLAGLAAIGAVLVSTLVQTGMPTSVSGWVVFVCTVLAGGAAVVRDDGSTKPNE